MRLKTLIGDYPVTQRFRTHVDRFDFAPVSSPIPLFKRVVRDLAFDVAELAIMTFLIARVHGKPLRLLPVVVVSRFQHACLVHVPACTPDLRPEDLAGKRVGLRSYSISTATWMRYILAQDHGVDLDWVHWVTFEEGHVAEYRDPPNAQRAPAGKELMAMLFAGELDAVISSARPDDDRLRPLISDPDAAARQWHQRHGAIQINHVVVVRADLPRSVDDEVCALLADSVAEAGNPGMYPVGIESMRRHLVVAIDCAYSQRMIPRRFDVDELFA